MTVSPAEGCRRWAATYDLTPNPLLALEERAMASMLGPVAALRVIDVGCGTGRWVARLAGFGARAAGFDICEQMLAQASRKPSAHGRLALADASRLPVASETNDLTLCSFVLGYVAEPELVMLEMARITKRGGAVIVSDLDPAAITAGWKRSFRADGIVREVEHFGHSAERIYGAGRAAGLELVAERQARFGEPERAIFQAAGKGEAFDRLSTTPAVWIGLWSRKWS